MVNPDAQNKDDLSCNSATIESEKWDSKQEMS